VRRAQDAGFTLSDVKTILDDQARRWPALVRDHLETLRTKRAQLDVMISMLEEVGRCGCEIVAECPRVSYR
jgi:DNA-binding transcriptional MerR regulator